jgi:hypothetical protein
VNSLRYLLPFPLLQILAIYFAFSEDPPRMFVMLAAATSTGFITFYFIGKSKKDKQVDWFLLVFPCFITAGLLTLPVGVWLMLYTGGGIEAVIMPFLIILPLIMSVFELNHIFRNVRKS